LVCRSTSSTDRTHPEQVDLPVLSRSQAEGWNHVDERKRRCDKVSLGPHQSEASGQLTVDTLRSSHLMGFFFRTLRMVDNGLKPMYVFDGKPPDLKGGVVSLGPSSTDTRVTGPIRYLMNWRNIVGKTICC